MNEHDVDDATTPRDETLTLCLMTESRRRGTCISSSGLHYIANHTYRAGDTTYLDDILSPTLWTYLTELLPLWLAPNMVTTVGGIHCLVAYMVLWHHSPDFDAADLPNWTVVLAGWCIVSYYTLDCMDGKQARRTNSSSPLGQLFDHGFDCICTYFFIIIMGTYVMLGDETRWIMAFQSSTQFAFYVAQWEEYHTHVLQSCSGKWIGVSEVNYSMGAFTILNGLFINRVALYQTPMKDVLGPIVSDFLPIALSSLEVRYFMLSGSLFMSATLMILSIRRVMNDPNIVGGERDYNVKSSGVASVYSPPRGPKRGDSNNNIVGGVLTPTEVRSRRIMALSKLVSPMILLVSSLLIPPTSVRTRYLSIALGIAFSLLTKKMIVFSMAKMAYAAIQFDVLPLLVTSLWIRCDPRLTRKGADFVMGGLCLWYLYRLLRWVNVTINQICERLNVYCFRLKPRTKMRVD